MEDRCSYRRGLANVVRGRSDSHQLRDVQEGRPGTRLAHQSLPGSRAWRRPRETLPLLAADMRSKPRSNHVPENFGTLIFAR